MFTPATAQIEAALITEITALLGNTVRKVDALGGAWTEATFNYVLKAVPGVYVAWIGARPDRRPDTTINTWALFVVAPVLNGQRRDVVGVYQLVELLTGWLHKRTLPGAAGAFSFRECANLYSEPSARSGIQVYGLYFDVIQPMPTTPATHTLDEFKTYYQQWPVDGSLTQESMNEVQK